MATLAALSLAIWVYLIFGRGGFWKADQVLPAVTEPKKWPSVAVIIPARNEAATIAEVVAAHRSSDYPGELLVFVCDDGSTDGTAEKAASANGDRPVTIVDVPDLPSGWSGKLWALNSGVDRVRKSMPKADYYLFTDADIVAGPSLLKKLVAQAERQELSLTSIMARLDDRGFWGGLLIPAFIFFFQKLYPFPLINDPESQTAGAAGGVVLLRPEALREIGGLEAMRGALIDDCTLAEKIKNQEPRRKIGLYLSSPFAEATSLRNNQSYEAMEMMVARTAYTQLGYNPMALFGTLVGMLLVYIIPAWAFLALPFHGNGDAALIGLITWGLMTFAYWPTIKRYGRGKRDALTLPLAALFYGYFTWLSGWRHWQGRGGQWKGRSYAESSSS